MKLFTLFALTTLTLFGAESPKTPPMPPQLQAKQVPPTDTGCEDVPPMLYMLPPPLQSALDACQNKRSVPTKEALTKTLSTKKAPTIILSVAPLEGFVKAYEVNTTVGKKKMSYVCNSSGKRCLKIN